MGTIKSSENLAFAEFLRSQRTTTEAEVRETTREHSVDDIPADVRWSSVAR